MKILRYHSLKGSRDPLTVSMKSWITDELRDELVGWVKENLDPNTDWHPRAHTWHFVSYEERDRFLAHRPMSDRVERTPRYDPMVKQYPNARGFTDFPFKPEAFVTVDSTIHQKLDFDEDNKDWFWVHVDDWIMENCHKRVGACCILPDFQPGVSKISMFVTHYGFESAGDALLFRIRWN